MAMLKSIYWHEGLFLRPQHFQQLDFNQQANNFQLIKRFNPYCWGVGELSIAQSTLKNNIVEISHCELIFPDGSYVRYPGNAVIERRTVDVDLGVSGKPISVYLGIKKLESGSSNVSSSENIDDLSGSLFNSTRYKVNDDADTVPDYFQDNKYEDIYFLDKNVEIFFNEEAEQAVDFSLIKIAEIHKLNREAQLSIYYIPPLLNVGGSPVLIQMLKDISEHIISLSNVLQRYTDSIDQSSQGLTTRSLSYLLVLQLINRYIPMIRQYVEDGIGSPWVVYGVLRQFVAELSTYSATVDVFGNIGQDYKLRLGEYNHDALTACFGRANKLISIISSELVTGPDWTIPLDYDGTFFSVNLEPKIFQGNNQFYLCVQTSLPQEEVTNLFQVMSKLSSRENLPILIARSLSGVNLEYDPSPPTAFIRGRDKWYFRVVTYGDAPHGHAAWEAIKETQNFALYLESPPTGMEIDLVVLRALGVQNG